MIYIVALRDFYLRGTVWAGSIERAQEFATHEAAQAQLDKAKPFMKVRDYKAATIIRHEPRKHD